LPIRIDELRSIIEITAVLLCTQCKIEPSRKGSHLLFSLLSLNWLFAALTCGLIVCGVALAAAITSGAWFGPERIAARG
jgi:hypothetical protein